MARVYIRGIGKIPIAEATWECLCDPKTLVTDEDPECHFSPDVDAAAEASLARLQRDFNSWSDPSIRCGYTLRLLAFVFLAIACIGCQARGYDPTKPVSASNVPPLKYDESKRPPGPHVGYEPSDPGGTPSGRP